MYFPAKVRFLFHAENAESAETYRRQYLRRVAIPRILRILRAKIIASP